MEQRIPKPIIRQLPSLFLTTQRDTIVSCSTCRATRRVSIKERNGQVRIIKCPACTGTGSTYISRDGYSKRY